LLSCSLSFLHCCADLLDLLSFPTRRSSDLSSKRQPESRLTSQANLHARTTRTKRASDVPTTSLRNNLAMLLHGAANSLERLPRLERSLLASASLGTSLAAATAVPACRTYATKWWTLR